MGSKISHAGQLVAHPQDRDDRAQLAGDRSLTGKQVEATTFDLLVQGVDLRVIGDDALSGGQVRTNESLSGVLDGNPNQLGHRQDPAAGGIELVVVALTHAGVLP